MSDDKREIGLEVHTDERLPAIFVDNLGISTRSDDMHFVQFMTSLPGGVSEQCRMMIPDEKLKRMIDVLCDHLKYAPKRPRPKTKARVK